MEDSHEDIEPAGFRRFLKFRAERKSATSSRCSSSASVLCSPPFTA